MSKRLGCLNDSARKRALRLRCFQAQGGRCGLCGGRIKVFAASTVDHVLPRALGGGAGTGNVVCAHANCNARKADRMPTGCELIWLLAVNARLGVQPQGW